MSPHFISFFFLKLPGDQTLWQWANFPSTVWANFHYSPGWQTSHIWANIKCQNRLYVGGGFKFNSLWSIQIFAYRYWMRITESPSISLDFLGKQNFLQTEAWQAVQRPKCLVSVSCKRWNSEKRLSQIVYGHWSKWNSDWIWQTKSLVLVSAIYRFCSKVSQLAGNGHSMYEWPSPSISFACFPPLFFGWQLAYH